MLKVGIIGTGRMGKAHAGNLAKLKSVTLTAVYDIVPAQAAAMKELHPTMEIMDSAAALVNNPEVDLIVIASPTYCHKEGLLAAMATGKPIFCEKPLCRSKEDFKELAPMISSYKNLFAIGFVRRYSAAVITMRNMLAEGKIGKPISSSAVFSADSNGSGATGLPTMTNPAASCWICLPTTATCRTSFWASL